MEPRATGSDLRHSSLFAVFREKINLVPKGELSYCWVSRPGFCVQDGDLYPETSQTERTCQGDPIGGAGSRHRIGSPEGRAFLLLGFPSGFCVQDGDLYPETSANRENVPGRSTSGGAARRIGSRFSLFPHSEPRRRASFLTAGFPVLDFASQDGDLPPETSANRERAREIRSVEPPPDRISGWVVPFRIEDQPRPEGRAFLLLGFPSWILRPGRGSLSRNVRKQRERARESGAARPIGGARATGSDLRDGDSLQTESFRAGSDLRHGSLFERSISLVPKGELSYCWVSRPGFCVQDGDLYPETSANRENVPGRSDRWSRAPPDRISGTVLCLPAFG